jgi:hypothetical protein
VSTVPPLTPEQCRRARILLGWSWTDFALEAGNDGATATAAHELESGHDVDREQLSAIRRVFETAGVEFLSDGSVYRRERGP